MLRTPNETLPHNYLLGDTGLFCNYCVVSKGNFDEYMRWSYPPVRRALDHQGGHLRSLPRSPAYLVERLFISASKVKGEVNGS
jgi:hypothetical protein